MTHLVVGVGTGGTISGIGRYLKERNPAIKVWGIDTYGSVFKKYKETGIFDKNEIYPYITEGIGEDFLPGNVDFSIIDHFEKVTDKDAAIMTRRLAREEGIWAGNSAGSAMAGLLQLRDKFTAKDTVVVVSDPLNSVSASPGRWLSKDFFKADRIRTLAVGPEGAAPSWKITRAEEWGQWKFAGGSGNLNPGAAVGAVNKLGSLGFEDVAGVDEARAELTETIEFLRNPERFSRLG